MSSKMKIEHQRERKQELAPFARIQITSSNATLTSTTTLAGVIVVLYAKRSCNPALAGMHVASGRVITGARVLSARHVPPRDVRRVLI